jgi:SAM-dependent methyltransferase
MLEDARARGSERISWLGDLVVGDRRDRRRGVVGARDRGARHDPRGDRTDLSAAAVGDSTTCEDLGARQRWDRLSRHYDRQLWLERSAVAAAIELLAPGPEQRLLDLGTGTGEVLRQLARRSSRPQEALGIDWSKAMLGRIGRLPAGWSVRLGDVRDLPLPDAAFGAASASYLLHLLAPTDLTLTLAEIRRVLRPGGRLVTVTPAIPAKGPARPVAATFDCLARRWPTRYAGLRALDPSPALEHVGFTVIRSRWSMRGYPSICVLTRA